MKLSKIKAGTDLEQSATPVQEAKMPTPPEDDVGPIPGMTKDDPDYEVMKKRLMRLRETNPALYKRMMNWD